jgi:IS5 family transposase
MAKFGLRGSEQSLHKSYDALIKLRKTRHYSWAELRNKVQRSQELPATARRPARGAKAPGLPLTTRDWRRIV